MGNRPTTPLFPAVPCSNLEARALVVGGSFAGIAAAQALEARGFDVTVLEPRDRVWLAFSTLRAALGIDEADLRSHLVPLDRVFRNRRRGRFVRGYATSVDHKAQVVAYTPVDSKGQIEGGASDLRIPYDLLVLATGNAFIAPLRTFAHEDLVATLAESGAKARLAHSFAIVGGGPMGVGLAASLHRTYPEAAITLLHRGPTLLSSATYGYAFPIHLRELVQRQLIESGVTVVSSTRAELPPRPSSVGGETSLIIMGPVKVRKTHADGNPMLPSETMRNSSVDCVGPGAPASAEAGAGGAGAVGASPAAELSKVVLERSIDPDGLLVDLAIWATGPKPNTTWLRGCSLGRHCLDKEGRIKVDESYVVTAVKARNVLALGDATNSLDARAAWVLPVCAAVLADNARLLVTQGKDAVLRKQVPGGLHSELISAPSIGSRIGFEPGSSDYRANLQDGLNAKTMRDSEERFARAFARSVGYSLEEIERANRNAP